MALSAVGSTNTRPGCPPKSTPMWTVVRRFGQSLYNSDKSDRVRENRDFVLLRCLLRLQAAQEMHV